MLLRKKTGGCTVAGYAWEHDGDVTEVPDELGHDLLSIRGGGYSAVAPEAEKPAAITEPAPAAKQAVTEPAPEAKAAVTEGKPAKAPESE